MKCAIVCPNASGNQVPLYWGMIVRGVGLSRIGHANSLVIAAHAAAVALDDDLLVGCWRRRSPRYVQLLTISPCSPLSNRSATTEVFATAPARRPGPPTA